MIFEYLIDYSRTVSLVLDAVENILQWSFATESLENYDVLSVGEKKPYLSFN